MGAAGKPEAKVAKERGAGTKPKFKLDKAEIERCARAGATLTEIAQRLGVSYRTLERRLEEKEYRDLIPKAEAELRISLRHAQVELALSGNAVMQIWLGKQILGQKDKLEHSDDGARQGVRFAGTMDQLLALYHQLTTEVQPAVIDVEPQRTLGRGNGHAGA